MNSVNQIQSSLRGLLKKGQIGEAIDEFDNYLKLEKISDRHISDTLITISSSYRSLVQLKTRDSIEYSTYTAEKNKITERLLSLMRDLPFVKKKESSSRGLAKIESVAITAIEKIQNNNLIGIREELLTADNLIINLFNEISEKEKQLIKERSQAQISILTNEVESLKRQIEREEERYEELKEKYENLKEEQEKIGELNTEIESLKSQITVKNEHINVLEERFIYSDKLLKQKEVEIHDLNKKVTESLNKNTRNKSVWLIIILVIIVILLTILVLNNVLQ